MFGMKLVILRLVGSSTDRQMTANEFLVCKRSPALDGKSGDSLILIGSEIKTYPKSGDIRISEKKR
jgi:hypothetical protein